MRQEANEVQDEGWTATEASAASAAAADGRSITKRQAAALEGTAASEAQEMNEKDEKIRALVQERKTTAKHEKDRIREISKEINKMHQNNKREKTRRSWKKSKVQRTFPVSSQ